MEEVGKKFQIDMPKVKKKVKQETERMRAV